MFFTLLLIHCEKKSSKQVINVGLIKLLTDMSTNMNTDAYLDYDAKDIA